VQSRAEKGQYYIDLLKDKGIQLPTIKEERTSVFAQFTLQSENREGLIKKLNDNDVPTAIHYPTPLHLQKCYKGLNYNVGDFPVSEKAANEVFSLPMSPFITKEQQSYIVDLF
jgi:UDP-2-acetamido-2-deoxy-ribo-hexuluronate aminotransferase